MTDDEIKAHAEAILERARKFLPDPNAEIQIQVGDLSTLQAADEHDGLACVILRSDNRAFIIAISPEAVNDPAGLDHVIMHEIVHVAHTMRCGDDDGETIEWLTDQLAGFLVERILEPVKA